MNWKNLINWNAVRNIFDWTPVNVLAPQPKYITYNDVGRILLGYEVQVTYRHHGVCKLLFATFDSHGKIGRRRALYRAIRFYKSTRSNVRAAALSAKRQK